MVDVVSDVVEKKSELSGRDVVVMDVVVDLLFVTKNNESAKGSTRDKRRGRDDSIGRIVFLSNKSHEATSVTRVCRAVGDEVGLVGVVEEEFHIG